MNKMINEKNNTPVKTTTPPKKKLGDFGFGNGGSEYRGPKKRLLNNLFRLPIYVVRG